MRRALALMLLASIAAPVFAAPTTWQRDITGADRRRLARLWDAWTRSLNQVQAAGQGAALVALGPVAVPDLDAVRTGAPVKPDGPLPGAGNYRCRTIMLGQRDGEIPAPPAAAVNAGPVLPCRITARNGTLWLAHDAGAQRLAGRLYSDGDRQVFLGTQRLTGEMAAIRYGADPQRNAVGVLRATGPAQWRLEMPWPSWQGNLAIVEIVPG